MIGGQPYVGKTLTPTRGSWQNGPTSSYTYQRTRCETTGQRLRRDRRREVRVVRWGLGRRWPQLEVLVTAFTTAVVANPVVLGTPTLSAAKPATICCQDLRLNGSVNPVKADEMITIPRPAVRRARHAARDVDDEGRRRNWSVIVTSKIATTYTAQADTAANSPLTVGAHPRVGFGVNGTTCTPKVTARDNVAGRIAYFPDADVLGRLAADRARRHQRAPRRQGSTSRSGADTSTPCAST